MGYLFQDFDIWDSKIWDFDFRDFGVQDFDIQDYGFLKMEFGTVNWGEADRFWRFLCPEMFNIDAEFFRKIL